MSEHWYDRRPFRNLLRVYWRVRTFQLRRVIREMEELPKFYGYAYDDFGFLEPGSVAYPIPFNIAVRAWHWLWVRLKAPRWGTAFADVLGRSKGLRIELGEVDESRAPAVTQMRVYLHGREITSELTGLDLQMQVNNPVTATLHYLGPMKWAALKADEIIETGE